ncbi:capping protein, Arp2/3 and myosin-I linker protein 3-like [Centroberyx gerrardi]
MASKEITASCFVSVSKDITESIRKIIDKSSIKFVRGIKLDTKNGKTEDRILVLTTWRLYFLAPKVPTKVETTFNFLEIRALNSHPEHQVIIDTDKSSYSLRFQSREHLNHVISHVNFALSRIFNNSVFAPSICHSDSDLSEGSRKYSPSSETSVETQRACGGFSETYAALCDYNGISCKEEVQWDVDTIYHSQDNREFNLLDFSHLESRDLAVIVASMAYNTWFTKLYCKDLRIGSEVTEQVLHTLSKSSSLEEITLENAGLKSDFPQKMSVALSENPASVIHSLNLAHNSLDNQGVSNLIQQVCRLSKGLRLLNLSKTSLSSKGVVSLSQALCSSDEYSNSLLHLDLSKNPGVLSGEDASNLYLFLSQPNCLVHLDLSGTDCCVDSLFGALLRGCCADLSFLNLSKNSFSHRKVKDTLPLFRQFFSSAFSLTHVSLASMKLPPDVLRALLMGLTSNPHINDLHLDISGCELRSPGAAVVQELFPRVSSIATLDISDNGLDADLLSVLPALSRHPSLKHLHLGKNFNIKNRLLDEVLQKLVQLIQEEECALQSLSLTDSRLRSRGTVLVNALGSNTCLRKVDLSGNNMDDIGAKMLSKALQINTTLRSVTWDRNNTSATGFLDVARALEHNFTLQYMPLPLSDISQAYRSAPERTEQALTKIQRALLRNNQTQRFSQRQALRLHQGLVTSTAEQVMERLCVRVQQQVCMLRGVGEMEEIQAAKQVLKEARNSRALYPSLCELAHVLSVDGPVRQRLDSLAGELAKAADKELQVIVDSMVSLCRELCPLSSSAAERLSPPLSSVSERVSIPRSAIRTALMERAAQDIHRALEEVKLSVVSYLTNSIVDQILQELYATHKTLTRQVSQVKRWDGTCEGGTGWRSHRHRDSLDITDEELSTSIDTIAIKKHSSRTRRIRPVSTRLSLCDDSSSSPPPSVPSFSSPLSRSASWEGLSELPTQGVPLHHVTRVRPRPPRRHRAGHIPSETHCSENGGISPLDDGLPDFYTKRVLPDSQLSSLHKAHSLRRKKRRNMLAIFGFRKNRNPTVSNQGPESGGEVYGEECHTVATAPTGTATENVYTLLQPPRSAARAGSPGEGADGKVNDHQGKNALVLSPPPVQGIPHPGMGGSKHPFYSPKEKPEVDAGLEQPVETERHWADDKQRTEGLHTDKQWMEGRQTDRHPEKHAERQPNQLWLDDRLSERTCAEVKTTDRQTDRYWTESRHPDRRLEKQWTVDRHTQRQIDRKMERQWTIGRQADRSWSENRPTDIQIDHQWLESRHPGRKTDRQVQALHLAQRPLPPYPSDRTPSPKQETDPPKSAEATAADWHLCQQEAQADRHACADAVGGHAEGWRGGGGASSGRAAPCASKPDPPPQSSKPNLPKLRLRHRQESSGTLPGAEEEDAEKDPGKIDKKERERGRDSEGQPPPIPEKPKMSSYVTFPKESAIERNLPPPPVPPPVSKPMHGLPDRAASQGEEGMRPQAPVKPQRNRKAMSCDAGTDRDSPNNLEKPPNRKPPVKKPRLPQNRNKSLDLSDSINSAPSHSELL